eukprot:7387289-Prymnesium_polylepis.2
MSAHSGKVYTIAFSPDGTRVVSGSQDGSIRLCGVRVPCCAALVCARGGFSGGAQPTAAESLSGFDDCRDCDPDEWVAEWKLEKKLAEWASDWGVAEVKAPTGAEICQALFRQSSCSSGHASRRSRTARWCSYVPAAAET